MGKLGDRVFHLSTIEAGVIAQTDAQYNDIPYASPSNHLTKMTAAVTKSGKELLLDLNQVNLLNENGIATLFNWESGWVLWGNSMACFPSNTDPKDRFVNIRRFYNWWAERFILTWFQKVDTPLNRRLLETIEDTENILINSYVAQGALVGSSNRITFRAEDNPTTDLIDGIVRAHTALTVPPPARVVENYLEYDPDNLLEIFM
jgi:phage tail sheath protein FI